LRTRQLEDKVLDQIGGQQRGAPVVQSLEDDLGVVAGLQIDHDELQVVPQGLDQSPQPGGAVADTVRRKRPPSDLLHEEVVRAGNRASGQFRWDLKVVVHGGLECSLVTVGWPDLEDLLRLLGDLRLVANQHLERLRIHLGPMLLGDPLCGVEQQLQGGESLLTVDHVPGGDVAGAGKRLV
jgi:hypothetical protein